METIKAGPGDYNIDNYKLPQFTIRKKEYDYTSLMDKQSIPGPGSYNVSLPSIEKKSHNKVDNSILGKANRSTSNIKQGIY